MKIKKKVLFLVPDGVGIKNYLYSNLLKHLKAQHTNIAIWSPLPQKVFEEVERLHGITIEYKQIRLLPDPPRTRLYREATTYARLIYNAKLKQNPTILNSWPEPKGYDKRACLLRIAQSIGRYLAKDYQRILAYEAKSKAHWGTTIINHYISELEDLQPHSIFITHQRVASLMPICLAAKKLDIKVSTAIFSWDNLPKARLCVEANFYLVWGSWMQQEMTDYYPEIPKEKVKLVGTPQFEFYLDETKALTRESFAEQYNLDVTKHWICFSGDDVKTSPHDAVFLEDVAEALASYKDQIQIIFRRCPVDFSERYDAVLKKYQNIIISIDPLWYVPKDTEWTRYFAKYDDITMQVNLANHCETVINLGSTMAHDFTMFNKPCLYLNYNPILDDRDWDVNTIYNFQHFRSMDNLDAVGWINSKDTIAEQVLNTINQPEIIASDRKLWMERVILQPVDDTSKLISRFI